MYKNLFAISLATSLFCFTACNSGTTEDETKDTSMTRMEDSSSMTTEKKDEGMMQPMTMMMDKMNAAKMTGDLDNDFATLMIAHHQGAVDMSEMEVAKGSDTAMIAMAKIMIADHKGEIEQLNSFITTHAASPEHKKDTAAHKHEAGSENELEEAMKGETSKIKEIKMTGNADKDYAMLMQAHHEDAINMSKAEVEHGHHAELKKIAKKMMADDEKEIKKFKDYLSSQP